MSLSDGSIKACEVIALPPQADHPSLTGLRRLGILGEALANAPDADEILKVYPESWFKPDDDGEVKITFRKGQSVYCTVDALPQDTGVQMTRWDELESLLPPATIRSEVSLSSQVHVFLNLLSDRMHIKKKGNSTRFLIPCSYMLAHKIFSCLKQHGINVSECTQKLKHGHHYHLNPFDSSITATCSSTSSFNLISVVHDFNQLNDLFGDTWNIRAQVGKYFSKGVSRMPGRHLVPPMKMSFNNVSQVMKIEATILETRLQN